MEQTAEVAINIAELHRLVRGDATQPGLVSIAPVIAMHENGESGAYWNGVAIYPWHNLLLHHPGTLHYDISNMLESIANSLSRVLGRHLDILLEIEEQGGGDQRRAVNVNLQPTGTAGWVAIPSVLPGHDEALSWAMAARSHIFANQGPVTTPDTVMVSTEDASTPAHIHWGPPPDPANRNVARSLERQWAGDVWLRGEVRENARILAKGAAIAELQERIARIQPLENLFD